MLDADESGLRDDTDEVDSVVFEGLGNVPREVDSYNDTEKVYTDAVEQPRNTSGEVTSKTDTIDPYTNVLEGSREADANITTTYPKKDTLFLPSCGILVLSAVFVNEGWRLVKATQEYFRAAKEDACSNGKEKIPVNVQLQSSQKNENTTGNEPRDNNTHVRFVSRSGWGSMNQQTACSSIHSNSSRKRIRPEDLEIQAQEQEPVLKICRLG
ncbi:hypothetical protein MKX08_006549 [Trichoderma sp. CBMAI-0020]|nr:hypothetical protein MKX08_006549 [Trichoderma sp. CBMAI-0020]WOD46102.1 hypothetical protein [Trichoderma atroviride]